MDTLSGFNYISPFAENEKPPDGAKLITDKPLSVFDNDFNYYVGANQYLSGKHVVEGFLKQKPKDNEMLFFCETDSQDTSNLFGTLFLVKIGANFKSLLLSFNEETPVKVNSKLNTNSSTTAHQVSTFDSFLNEIYKFLQKEYGGYIEKDFLTFERLKKMILDEISIVKDISRTIGESMIWYNDGVKYVVENINSFLEGLLFTKEDYTPNKNKNFSNSLNEILDTVADYIVPDSIEKKMSQIKSDIGKLIQKSIPENWRHLIHKIYGYIEQAIEIFNNIGNVIVAGFHVYKAYFCGIINGLISTIQFVIQIVGWIVKSHFSTVLTGELFLSIQSKLEFIEDFIDVFNETKDDVVAGMKKLMNDFELDSLLAIAKSLYGNTEASYTIYDYAYLAGRIVFEIIIAVLLTLFTGGGEAIKLASTLSQKALEIAKFVGKEAFSVISGGITDLVLLLKTFLLKFAQACKNGWKALRKFFEELLSVDKPKIPEEKVIEEVSVVVSGKGKNLLNEADKIYRKGYDYKKVEMPDGYVITKLFSTRGHKLVAKVEQYFKTYKNISKTQKNDIVLVSGIISRKYFDNVVLHTNFPDRRLQNFLKKNKINRFNSNLDDIKKIYEFYLEEGHIKYNLHHLLEKRLIKHFEKLEEGIKHTNYQWNQTGGLPGIHAEVLSVNEMLHCIESIMNSKGLKITDKIFTEMIGFNKRFNSNKVMIRCGDCNFLTYDIPFVEQFLK